MGYDVHWQWENDGRILLRCDRVQRLQVAQLETEMRTSSNRLNDERTIQLHPVNINYLESRWGLGNNIGSFLQRFGGLLFTFSSDDFSAGFASSFSFSGHGPLQLDGQTDVLTVEIKYSNANDIFDLCALFKFQIKIVTFQRAPL